MLKKLWNLMSSNGSFKLVIIVFLALLYFQSLLFKNKEINWDNLEVTQDGLTKIYWTLNGLQQDDHRLIQIIKDHVLVKPNYHKDLNIKADNYGGQFGQPFAVEKILGLKNDSKKKGFFIEAGAAYGDVISNSLYFEVKHGWTGLLVEPNPDLLKELYSKNRKAYILPHCLSTKPIVETVTFDVSRYVSGIVLQDKPKPSRLESEDTENLRLSYEREIQVQCFPLYSVLMALDKPHIDYFSLDIEGAEFAVLQTLPWSQLNVTVIDVEVNHAGAIFPGTRQDIETYLSAQNFSFVQSIGVDEIFVNKANNRF